MTKRIASLILAALLAAQPAFASGIYAHAPNYTGEAERYFAAFSVQPSTSCKLLINTLIQALRDGQVLPTKDHIYLRAVPTQQGALLDMLHPSGTASTITANGGALTFVAGAGFTGDALAYIDTNQVRSTQLYYTQNSANISAYSTNTYSAVATSLVGAATASRARLISANTSLQASGDINDSTTITGAVGTGIGFFSLNRSGASARQIYSGTVQGNSDSQASVALTATDFLVLRDGTSSSPRATAYESFGGSETATVEAAEGNAVTTFMVSAPTVCAQ